MTIKLEGREMKFYSMAFNKYLQFTGRSRRAEYFWFNFINVLIVIALALIATYLGPSLGVEFVSVMAGITGIFGLFIFIPTISILARRLHDLNLSAWLILIYIIIASVFQTILTNHPDDRLQSGLVLIGLLFNLILCFIPGTKGPNKYGPDPKEFTATMPQDIVTQQPLPKSSLKQQPEATLPKKKEKIPDKIPEDPFKGFDG